MVYEMGVGLGGGEGRGVKAEVSRCIIGGGGRRWSSSQRENATKHSTVLRNI